MNSAEKYISEIKRLVDVVETEQKETLEKASSLVADALCGKGYVFTFGTGHSHLLAEEIFYRAGGMARVCPILDEKLMLHISAAKSTNFKYGIKYGCQKNRTQYSIQSGTKTAM